MSFHDYSSRATNRLVQSLVFSCDVDSTTVLHCRAEAYRHTDTLTTSCSCRQGDTGLSIRSIVPYAAQTHGLAQNKVYDVLVKPRKPGFPVPM
jgi:hypothetical protein